MPPMSPPPNGDNERDDKWNIVTRLTRVERDVFYLQQEITRFREDRVRHIEFRPVQAIAFGLVGLILLAVIGAMISVVVAPGG